MQYQASHSVVCDAPPAQVYGLISDARRWPDLLEPCEAVEVLAGDGTSEHLRISARVNGELMTWESHRRFLPEVFGIQAVVVKPMKLVAAMTTTWRVVGVNDRQSLLLLEHDYDLLDDVTGEVGGVVTREQAEAFIERAIDRNSTVELGNLKAAVERSAAPGGRSWTMRHSIVCRAAADDVYALIRSTDSWPRLFDACTGVTILESTGGSPQHPGGSPQHPGGSPQNPGGSPQHPGDSELVRVEAVQGGRPASWDTRRRYHDRVRRVEYELVVPMPLTERMSGEWRVVELGDGRCLLTVDRRWQVAADVTGSPYASPEEAGTALYRRLDANADAEMVAIKALVEEGTDAITSTTSHHYLPHPPDRVYELLADVSAWPAVLPHCDGLTVTHDDGRHQEFSMDVQTPHGAETFRSVRICDPGTLTISYFQPVPPPVLARHSGSWEVVAAPGGCEVVSRHTALVAVDVASEVFGTDDVSRLKGRVREQLERNSGLTVQAVGARLSAPAGPAVAVEDVAVERVGPVGEREVARV